MIKQIDLPTKEQLAPLVEEGLATANSRPEFIKNHLTGVMESIKHSPLIYRAYGPYWWIVKSLLLRHGFLNGAQEKENVTRNHFSYDDDVFSICAAWAYQQQVIDHGFMVSSIHTFDVDGEPYDYHIEDIDMEGLAINKLF